MLGREQTSPKYRVADVALQLGVSSFFPGEQQAMLLRILSRPRRIDARATFDSAAPLSLRGLAG
jgi:hypothetical protein